MEEDWRRLNRANWDERTALHLGPRGYDLSTHRAGSGRLDPIVEAMLPPLEGLRLLHLQCHIGDDSLALLQRGAKEVTGVDWSPPAIAAARALADETGAAALRFVESDVLAAPEAMPGEEASFDLIFTSWGTIGWLPDIRRWARVVAHFLRPGGRLLFADGHPVAAVFDGWSPPGDPEGKPGWLVPYFERKGRVFEDAVDYCDPSVPIRNSRTVAWLHPLGDVLDALHEAGLRLERLREHDRLPWAFFPGLVRGADGLWTWPSQPWLPLSYSLVAIKG